MIISVVGSGGGCIGYGKEIDSADCVVRIWDCFWHDEKDHGTRYDVGVMRDRKHRKPLIDSAIKKGIFRIPQQEWWSYGGINQNLFGANLIDGNYFFYGLPIKQVNLEGLKIKTRLTTGSVAIVGALNLKPTKLMLYGFDSVISGKFANYHAQAPKKKSKIKADIGKRKPKSHDYTNDLNLIKELGKNIEMYHHGKRI